MLKKAITRELEKIRVPYQINEDESVIIFSMQGQGISQDLIELEVGKSYLVCLNDSLIHEKPDSTFSSNWNKGIIPKSKNMKITVLKKENKMLKVDGFGYDCIKCIDKDDVYMGFWLPEDKVIAIEKL